MWCVFIIVGYAFGLRIKYKLWAHFSNRIGDRLIYATWLGILFYAMICLLLSVFMPLTAIVGLSIFIGITVLGFSSSHVRGEMLSLFRQIPYSLRLGLLILLIGVAIFDTKYVSLIDTGGYHVSLINWISTYGVSWGLGLLHPRYGYTSSWLAMHAPMNHGMFELRVMSFAGGLALVLFFSHVVICLSRLLRRSAHLSDFFIISSSTLTLLLFTTGKFQGGFFRSTSPDVPVFILLPLIFWILLVIIEQESSVKNISPQKFESYLTTLSLIIVGAINVKLSAIAGVVAIFILAVLYGFANLKHLLKPLLIGILGMLPALSFSFVVTGCPIFPLPICVEVNWSLGTALAKSESEIITSWARWNWWHGPDPNSTLYEKVDAWAKYEQLSLVMLAMCLIALVIYLVFLHKQQSKKAVLPNALLLLYPVLGLVFWAYSAPTLRFGLGILILLPSLAASVVVEKIYRKLPDRITTYHDRLLTLIAIIIGVLYGSQGLRVARESYDDVIKISMRKGDIPIETASWLFLPPRIVNGYSIYFPEERSMVFRPQRLNHYEINDIQYSSPVPFNYRLYDFTTNQCWALDLMCTTRLGYENIRLLNPNKGVAGGFVKVTP
jgi:hypothetical protein